MASRNKQNQLLKDELFKQTSSQTASSAPTVDIYYPAKAEKK